MDERTRSAISETRRPPTRDRSRFGSLARDAGMWVIRHHRHLVSSWIGFAGASPSERPAQAYQSFTGTD